MQPVLGVEGGGSHSHAIVVDAMGSLLGIGANDDDANWDDVGIEAASAAIRSCVREALDGAGLEATGLAASLFALAGVDFPMDGERLGGIPASLGLPSPHRIVNDAFAALRAGTDEPFGVVVIAGTGSVVAGWDPSGQEFRTLGMGPMFGDSGSVSEVSEAGVTAVALASIGRGPQTALSKILCEAAGVGSVIEFLEGAARGRIDPSGFARTVTRAAGEGDEVACSILTIAGATLGATAAHVVRQLGMEEMAFDLVLSGGMFRAETAHLIESLEAEVRPIAPHARIRRLEDPPVIGSGLLAIELGGEAPAPGARDALATALTSTLRR